MLSKILAGFLGPSTFPRVTTLALALARVPLFVVLSIGLDRTDLHNDEAIYAYAVDSLLESDDWWTPLASITQDPYLAKPPLKIWIVTAGIRLGLIPNTEGGLRTFDAVFACLALLYVFAIGTRLMNPLAGAAAAFFLSVQPSLLFVHGLRWGTMEAMLVLHFSASVYHLLAWADGANCADGSNRRRRVTHIVLLAGWQAFGILAKSTALMAPASLAPIVLLYRPWRQRLWQDRWWWLTGAALSVGLIAPWYWVQTARYGAGFWHKIVGTGIVDRYTAGLDPNHLKPWSYYLSFIYQELTITGTLLWVVIGAALWLFRIVQQRWAAGALVVAWIVLPLAVISTSASKLAHYLYPSLPALALFGGFAFAALTAAVTDGLRRLAALPRVERWVNPRITGQLNQTLVIGTSIAALVAGLVMLIQHPERPGAPIMWLVGVVMLALASRASRSLVAVGVVLAVGLLPWALYRPMIERALTQSTPLGALRACIDELAPQVALGPDQQGRLFFEYPAGRTVGHPSFYYFRDLNSWQLQRRQDPALLYFRLYVPGHQAPTQIPADEYLAFAEHVRQGDLNALADKLSITARAAGLEVEPPDPATLEQPPAFHSTQIKIILLPGPYAPCIAPVMAAGGYPFTAP